jgi:hypothetical protein
VSKRNEQEYERLRELITRLTYLWQHRMTISHIEIETVFLDEFYPDDEGDDWKVTAVTEGRWQYDCAKIKWYLPSLVRHSDSEIERVVVHELCHVMLGAEQSIMETVTGDENEDWTTACSEKIEMSTERACRALLNTGGSCL